jgi:hypothetical protein
VRPRASVEVVFGEGDLAAPSVGALKAAYAEAGLAVRARLAGAAEVAELGTSWSKRLTRSDRGRRFWRLEGAAVATMLRPGSARRTSS